MTFQKGQSGNPKGRLVDKIWREAVARVVLDSVSTDKLESPKKNIDKLARVLFNKGIEGDVSAIKEIADRLDGKAAQAINLGDSEGEPLSLTVTIVKPD